MTIHVSAQTARTVSLCLGAGKDAFYFLPEPKAWTLWRGDEIIASGTTDRVVTFLDGLAPATHYRFALDGETPCEFATPPCAGDVDIRDHGATPDALNNADAIAAAVAAVSIGGTLRVPAGRWKTGPIFLKSDMVLQLDEGATLAFITDRDSIPILPARTEAGTMLGSWEGLPDACFASLITALYCKGLHITGRGTLDGGGADGDWWDWPKETRDGARRPRTLFMNGCESVSISGITVCNSPSWTIHPLYCKDITFSALKVQNPADSPNTDGLDPECCDGVLIEGVHFTVGDDCIAIKACKRGPNREDDHIRPCTDITVRHCFMERGHGAVVIGSEMSGSVTNVTIEHCEFLGTDRGLRLKTRRGRGGEIANISLRRCKMDQVDTAIVANCFYFCDADGKSEWVQSRSPYPVDQSTPHIHDITIRDVTIDNVRVAVGAFYGLPEAPITDVSIRAVTATFDDSESGDVPVMALEIPVCHHESIVSHFADLTIENCSFLPSDQLNQEQANQC
ncbi:glycoside hydrolase family 28 protein [uncultured Cohaesibacter sp.]|uniref:polygalacturonase PglA n=1 Tax=uncultured Cohaesibacter sp. TaxID=1002546 RepID=UPI0029C7139D|nr:glycoside hydrolase family 28 protein [uncultured Cohaesibacter sp.]